ncbi:MAG TPA: DUF2752 domain-containing protein [Fimbriiglobus sp.]|jgi:hypothetical protein
MAVYSFHRRLVRGSLWLLLTCGAAAGLYVLAVVPPTTSSWYPPCMLHATTGLHCPGCGLTRAVHAALNGNFSQAFAYNVLAPVFLAVAGFAAVKSLWYWTWGTNPPQNRETSKWIPIGIAVCLVLFGILRNIPAYPFTLLAPHEI